MVALLEMRDVHVSFSGFLAVAGLNLTVDKGELRCLIGPNGAGKTTALDVICGKTKAAAGEIRYRDNDITHWQEYSIARLGIGRKFQVPSVFKELTVRENLWVAYCKKRGVFQNLFQGHNDDSIDGLEKLAEIVGLKDELHRPARRSFARPDAMAGDRPAARAGRRSHPDGRADRRHDQRRRRTRPPNCLTG